MLNFRKLRQDFSTAILKEGKELYEKKMVSNAKILRLDGHSIRLTAQVKSMFNSCYESEIEIDRKESMTIDSNCDCSYNFDCQHIAALLFYLEEHLNEIVVSYAKESAIEEEGEIEESVKEELKKTFEEAALKEGVRKDNAYQKEVLREYVASSSILGASPFFLLPEKQEVDKAELALVFTSLAELNKSGKPAEFQLYLRIPFRSKPLLIPNLKVFLQTLSYEEPMTLNGKRYFFTKNSFSQEDQKIIEILLASTTYSSSQDEKFLRFGELSQENLGKLFACAYELAMEKKMLVGSKELIPLPSLYGGNLEEPLCFSTLSAEIQVSIQHLKSPVLSLLLKPKIILEEENIALEEILFLEANSPGLFYKNTYYRFSPKVLRAHLKSLPSIDNMVIPEPLFGTFIENALPVLKQYVSLENEAVLRPIVTLPYTQEIKGRCIIHYLNGELEAELLFIYGQTEVPSNFTDLQYHHLISFIDKERVIARNLVEEKKLIDELFQDFLFSEKEGVYKAKSEKKIVEFMTEIIPKFQHRIKFECPENLQEQFIYDNSTFAMALTESNKIDSYEIDLKVDGYLKGSHLDTLWECVSSKRRFLELKPILGKDKKRAQPKIPKILVLDLEKLSPLVQIFDEMGIKRLDNEKIERPLWSLTSVLPDQFKNLPLNFSMSKKLKEIQKQIVGEEILSPQNIPKEIQANLRNYQLEGVHWLERLRKMHLNGILADDMGLGKTLQAIVAITQSKKEKKAGVSLIIAPTSLVHNWKEEFNKFHQGLKVAVIDAHPSQRKKMIQDAGQYDVLITSYNLLQKDVEHYKDFHFDYLVLDEAQHIKNRTTRNAKSVKLIQARHRLILTGTPIENSLEELWSLFDFLMPGLLSGYDRFVEKYIRASTHVNPTKDSMENLKRKVSPFILRRMKEDVLDDLPPVSEIVYHCHLTETQRSLYNSYAASAKEELSKLVKKEGFDKIHIHVLATLTRLKQICCHPAIFAKEKVESGDSAKYDMLMELLPTLIEGKHKAVIFSQYTKMLSILKQELEEKKIKFSYLDGSSKNRLEIVKNFNEDSSIPLFLVSLKAGGSGLNLVGADTVIHYDMWWNPAVENQATDRVHRLGQKKSVSSYKLITLNTIEEKIQILQNRKRGLVKKVINSDEEALAKLTWEEVLELLQT